MKHACVDLFCGAGGLTNGLLSAGINVVCGVDFEKRCKFPYEFNNKAQFHCMDVRKLTHEHLRTWMGDVDFKILAGCAPCQPFSNMNTDKSTDDKRRTPPNTGERHWRISTQSHEKFGMNYSISSQPRPHSRTESILEAIATQSAQGGM